MNGLNRDNYFYPPARRARGAMGWNQIQQKAHRDARRAKKSQQPRIAGTNKNHLSAVANNEHIQAIGVLGSIYKRYSMLIRKYTKYFDDRKKYVLGQFPF